MAVVVRGQNLTTPEQDASSTGTSGLCDSCDCSKDQLDIKPETAFVDILDVHPQPVVKIHIATSAHLPKAGDARLDFQSLGMPHRVSIRTKGRRAGPDEAHSTPDDVEDLRQFIHAGLPQNSSDTSDPRIIGNLEIRPCQLIQMTQLLFQFFRIRNH